MWVNQRYCHVITIISTLMVLKPGYCGQTLSIAWLLISTGAISIKRCCLNGIGISMLKIRRSCDCLIFNMGIAIPRKDGFVLRWGPGPVHHQDTNSHGRIYGSLSSMNRDINCQHHVFVAQRLRMQICTQIARFIGPTWGPPGSCQPQVGPMLAPSTLQSGSLCFFK